MPVRIKICGIMAAGTAEVAAAAGADAIGFVFAPGRRHVTVDQAREIASVLPPFVTKVGVFVDEDAARVQEIADEVRLDAVQLHGSESPEYCGGLRVPIIKAIRMRDEGSLRAMARYQVMGFLLDSYDPDLAGGTGRPFNWHLISDVRASPPVILSGGLNIENVREALEIVRPYGVDISSGVETNGQKDPAKIRAFISRVRDWSAQASSTPSRVP